MQSVMESSETGSRIFDTLVSLNQIGAAINRTNQDGSMDVQSMLCLIVESANKVVAGSAAVIYTFDLKENAFDPASRVSAGERLARIHNDAPRPDGIGMRAIQRGLRVISYEENDLQINPEIEKADARVVACFPLIVAQQPVGALYIYLFEERHFTHLEELMVDNFVNLAAMAIYQACRLDSFRRDLARKEEELNRLQRTGYLISSRLGLKETLEAILRMALEVTNAKYGIFRLMDKAGQNLISHAIAGDELSRPQVNALPVDEHSVMGWVAVNQQPVCIYDLKSEPWSQIYYPLDADMQMRSELAVPLINASGRVEGVLNLESPQVGAFSEQDRHLLQSLANQAVIAIEEVRLLDALQEVAQLMITHPSQVVLARLVELASDLLNASASMIWLLEDDWLVLQAASGSFEHEKRLPLHNSLTGQAVLTRSVVMTDDMSTDERFNRPDLARAQGWARALIVPLIGGEAGEPIGAFSLYSVSSSPGHFAESEWDKKVLTCLAHYAVLTVQNAAQIEALRTAQEQRAMAETFAAVGDIAANLLHQLNNKVGTIPVRIQGIQDKRQLLLADDVYLATNLAEIERSANEAMQVMRQNLSHLRPIHLAEVNVAACVDGAIEAANVPDDVEIEVEGLDGLPAVIAGQRSLELVFSNLIENAIDAMKGQGGDIRSSRRLIKIRGSLRHRMVEISVSDSGPGIPPELHGRIFELNYSNRSQARPGKLGFGLWWVKSLVARLGGSVSVESDGTHGATFRLRLPIVDQK